MGAARRHRRQCPARRRGADRAQPHRPRQARPRVRNGRDSRDSPRRPATSNRPRPRSAASCSTCRRPAATSPTASSPPRPTSPSRPTSAPGSTSAACSAAAKCPTSLPRQKIASAQKWSATNQGQHVELGHRREQSVPDAGGGRALGRPVRPAPVPHRHALRPVHRPRPRCAQLRLLPGRALPARRDAERDHARPRGRRAPVDQPAADRARPAGPAPLRAGLSPTSSRR